ncbi:MAG: hypothetical protein JW944_07010 [Deltaproteobacteria bacterium]|nr:hypothetical protein [Deltaproteobacteria bacterium]
MSRVVNGHNDSKLKIGNFEIKEVKCEENRVPLSDFSKGHSAYGPVSSWDFPLVEQEESHDNKKEDFKERLARLEKEAYEKGFEQGQKDGFALEKRKMEEVKKQIEEMLVGLRDLKPRIYSEAEEELLKLVMLVARKVTGEEVRNNSGIIGNTIKNAMKFLSDKRKVRIILSPDDMDEVKKLLPDISAITKGGQFQLSEDKAVSRGGCILETGFGRINACIEDQLDNLEKEIDRLYKSGSGDKP